MADKLMNIHNDDTQNNLFSRLKLLFETFEHLPKLNNQLKFNKVPKVVTPMNKKTLI